MTEEFEVCSSALTFSEDIYKQIYLNSIEAAFACDETKKWLKTFI
jgi:adenosine deaminase